MKGTNGRSSNPLRIVLLVVGTAVLAVSATLGILYSLGAFASRTRSAEIAARGAQVMPFALDQTHHVFQQLADGGLQTVTANDPANQKQIALIQAHLKDEVDKFRRGDFADPAAIHGPDMPGLADLKAGAPEIDVQYIPLPNGAQIRYTTPNPALVMALHHWFATQLSDHAQDASDH